MTISTRLNEYLEENNIAYQSVPHFHSTGSIGSAVSSSVPAKQVAKAVVLSDRQGHKMMAVLPADKKISFSVLNEKFNTRYQLLHEEDVYDMFADCKDGAVPPAGGAYDMSMVCEQLLDILDEVYIEAGDHETLLRLDSQAFKTIMADAKHIRFGKEMYH